MTEELGNHWSRSSLITLIIAYLGYAKGLFYISLTIDTYLEFDNLTKNAVSDEENACLRMICTMLVLLQIGNKLMTDWHNDMPETVHFKVV